MTDDDKPGASYDPIGGYRIDGYPTYAEGVYFARTYWDYYASKGVNPDPAYYTDDRLAEIGRDPI
jgi:hypothetical protein